jgi:hypothetical protein
MPRPPYERIRYKRNSREVAMKKPVSGLTLATIVAGLTMSVWSAGVQPPAQVGSATASAEVADRLKSLELQAKTLEEKYAQAVALQADYRAFYERALNTQTYTIWAIGILLTAMLAVAGRVGLRAFERQTEAVIARVVSEFRVSMEERLRAETGVLAERSQKQVADAIGRLTKEFQARLADMVLRMRATHLFDSANIFIAVNQYDDAVETLRSLLVRYAEQTDVKAISKNNCIIAIRNLFNALNRKDPENFQEAARQELSRELYGKLREEVILAGHEDEDLRGVLSEIGWRLVPDKPAEQQSTKTRPEDKAQT